jgi:outer membrane protein assembly factor BamB
MYHPKLILALLVVLMLVLAGGCSSPFAASPLPSRQAAHTPLVEATTTTMPLLPGASSSLTVYRGDLARTGVYQDEGQPLLHGGQRLWVYRAKNYIETPAVVGDGFAFVSSPLQAVNIKTGERAFTLETNSISVIDQDALYYSSKDGLHAMDLATGEDMWDFNIQGEASSPVVYDGVVYFGVGDSTSRTEGTGALYAVDTKTGKEKWRFGAGDLVHSVPAIADGMIYFVSEDIQWQVDVGMNQSTLHALDLVSGKQVWEFRAPSNALTPGELNDPTVYDGIVYCASPFWVDLPGSVFALDAKTGREVWKHTMREYGFDDPEPAAAYQGAIYVAASQPGWPQIYVFDAKTGQEKWRFRGRGDFLKGPAISEGILYAAAGTYIGEEGVLYALNTATGEKLQEIELDFSPEQPPVVSDGVLYVVASDDDVPLQHVLVAIK